MDIVVWVIIALIIIGLLGFVTLFFFRPPGRLRATFGLISFSISLVLVVFFLYSGLAFPHGPSVRYTPDPNWGVYEDTSQLDIPTWVKSVRLIEGLIFGGFVISTVAGVGHLVEYRGLKHLTPPNG